MRDMTAFYSGYNAIHGDYTNPYDIGSNEYEMFEEGMKAFKQDRFYRRYIAPVKNRIDNITGFFMSLVVVAYAKMKSK